MIIMKLLDALVAGWRRIACHKAVAPIPLEILSSLDKVHQMIESGNLDGAEHLLTSLQKINSNDDRLCYLLGSVKARKGEYDAGISLLCQAIATNLDLVDAYVDLGNIYRIQGELVLAENNYSQALSLNPDHILALCNLGGLYDQLGRQEEATRHFRHALSIQPWLLAALNPFVHLLINAGQYEEAIQSLERSQQSGADPGNIEAGLCFVLQKQDNAAEALPHCKTATSLLPEDPLMWDNLGTALQDLGKLDDAIRAYEKAIDLNPDVVSARWHRSLAYLLRGEYGRAWPDYELRLLDSSRKSRIFPFPRWGDIPCPDEGVLVYAEQGLGDEIMFASCLPDLIGRVGHCVIECSDKLEPIFARSFPRAKVHGGKQIDSPDWVEQFPGINYCIPIGSLPLYFRNSLEDFPAHSGYLLTDSEKTAYWRMRLDKLGPGLKVGISWRGGTRISRGSLRSLQLEQLLPIFQQSRAHFINLQYDSNEVEVMEFCSKNDVQLHHWKEALEDYDATAALVNSLDLVVSVCTAIVHLSGALGKPVWVLVSASPEWRYGSFGEQMPWYPSSRLFRQKEAGEWDIVIDEVKDSLCLMENRQ